MLIETLVKALHLVNLLIKNENMVVNVNIRNFKEKSVQTVDTGNKQTTR